MGSKGICIHAVGTRVSLKLNPSIEGIITAVCVRFNDYFSYEVTYFNGSDNKVIWMIEPEFEVMTSPSYRTIGFYHTEQ